MSGSLTLSWWLFVPLAVLAALGLWGFVVLPLARAILRARRRKVVAALNPKLQLEMPPFQLTRREFLADRLANDPKIAELVEETATARGVPLESVQAQVAAYAREIVPAFNPYFYFRFGYLAARSFMRSLYRVRLGYQDADALAKVSSEDSVIFFCNHRSNIDYVLVTYLAAGNTTLSFGVGEWARHWPFQQLMRSAGAYFVRRDSKDPLYRRILERYVQLATEARVTQAIFPEGALSRDGGLQTPKLGLLDYMTNAFDREGERDIVFMPIGVNYDRVPEEWNLVTNRDLALKRKGDGFVLRMSLIFLAGTAWLKLRRWRHPFGGCQLRHAGFAEVMVGAPRCRSAHTSQGRAVSLGGAFGRRSDGQRRRGHPGITQWLDRGGADRGARPGCTARRDQKTCARPRGASGGARCARL
jgi:glycerol-3-phosphate O-acyltransferase